MKFNVWVCFLSLLKQCCHYTVNLFIYLFLAVKEMSVKSATSCVKVKIKLARSFCNCKHWPPPLLQLPRVDLFLHKESLVKHTGSSEELLTTPKRFAGWWRKQTNKQKNISNVHLLFPRESSGGGLWAAEEEETTTTTGPIRECQVQKIGLYDTETGIKPRPGVTHLLNHGNLSIALPVCTRRCDINSELVMAKGNDGRLLD